MDPDSADLRAKYKDSKEKFVDVRALSRDPGFNIQKGHLEPVLMRCWISSLHPGLQGGGRCATEKEPQVLNCTAGC